MLQSACLCLYKIPGLCWDIAQVVFELMVSLSALASLVLGLQVHTTVPRSMYNYFVAMETLKSESEEVQSLEGD